MLERPFRFFRFACAGAALALASLSAPAVGQQESDARPLTIERILGAPFPSELVAAPTGAAFAWVRYEEGVRNIWVASGPDFRGRAVTAYGEDDGQAIGDLAFTPDGRRLLFVRGGAPNRQSEIPNPTSDPRGAEREIWLVDLEGPVPATPLRIGEGSSPVPSPDGERVVFQRGGQLWWAPLDAAEEPGADGGEAEPPGEAPPQGGDASGGAEGAARPLARTRGRVSSVRWSPDGTRIAFTSSRGDHAFIGLLEPEAGTLRYLDPALDRDRSPAWSPDGGRIAFLRVPNEGDRLPFAPQRTGIPWSIRVVDVESGEAHEVWRAPPGPGSAFQGTASPRQLLWGADDRLVFPWEGDGWLHLYSVPASGGSPEALTPGPFEVEHVTLAPDGRRVVFSSNQGDIDRRHLWSVDVAGGPPEPLTPGDGIEWSPAVSADGRAIAFLASEARRPARAEVLGPDGVRRPLAEDGLPAGFPLRALAEPEAVVFEAEDGVRVHGQLFLPPDAAPGDRRPGVLFFHGGSRRQMLLGWHYIGYYHNAYAMNQYLASRGYVVLSVNYRSGTGYGLEFREALDYGARGASEYRDVVAAGRWLAARPEVDPDRIGLWGGSYGGYLTALGLARDSELFAAGVDLHGVHDWNVVIRNFVPSYDPARREAAARLAHESSPMAFLDGWRSPVLLIHGDDDRNVPFSESVDLAEQLRRRDVPFEQLVFPDEVHGFLLHANWLAAYRATADFLERKLREPGLEAGGGEGR